MVTLTVTNTALPVHPSSSIAASPLATATNPVSLSKIPSSPPTFFTATDQDFPPPSSLPSISLPSSISPAASALLTPVHHLINHPPPPPQHPPQTYSPQQARSFPWMAPLQLQD
ncbi:hypothetical protein PGT21_021276 [Puccinia graminis f. sp. tritici]|uniref:Uncharacterized protein n=1 Tax=Puccinia graminis f. sp. tritici TaxID=56615 RepID=A0A5B0PJV7_PUCGR|nr:hypothetical protein PGT21_021276 [Puccinia graminis f. sp. tritici]